MYTVREKKPKSKMADNILIIFVTSVTTSFELNYKQMEYTKKIYQY